MNVQQNDLSKGSIWGAGVSRIGHDATCGCIHPMSECMGLSPGSNSDSTFLLMCTQRGGQRSLKSLDPWHTSARPKCSSRLLASA